MREVPGRSEWHHAAGATAKRCHCSGTPLMVWAPRSPKRRPGTSTRSKGPWPVTGQAMWRSPLFAYGVFGKDIMALAADYDRPSFGGQWSAEETREGRGN